MPWAILNSLSIPAASRDLKGAVPGGGDARIEFSNHDTVEAIQAHIGKQHQKPGVIAWPRKHLVAPGMQKAAAVSFDNAIKSKVSSSNSFDSH